MAINIDEKILFQRGGKSENGSNKYINPLKTKNPDDLKTKTDQGVLVIDPNKVVNKYNEVVDRYVKQEDLVMYTTLKVYKRAETAVVYTKDQTRLKEKTSEPIHINFLNPVRRKTTDGYSYKGKMTSEWTDFFTSNAANDKTKANYILDPETFGITNISIKINASYLPIITIEFTDIQGRTLFERGNEADNPYNIFYTYPYPKFSLVYKGYYGKAVETQLVLLKSNTRFDPSNGNYTVTAEFSGEVYALFNTFLLIYGYVAPYMFPSKDGKYLGRKILNGLYDRQNKLLEEKNPNNYDDYKITSYPTLVDLAKAIKKIPISVINPVDDNTVESNEKLISNKTIIQNYESYIRTYIEDSPDKYNKKTDDLQAVAIYEPVDERLYKIDLQNKTPGELSDFLDRINTAVKEIGSIERGESNTQYDFTTSVLEEIKKNSSLEDYLRNKKIEIGNILDLSVFNYKKNTTIQNPVFIDDFNTIIGIVFNNISTFQRILEEDYLTDQITDIGKELGYKPNLSNIIRIICNNMQTFLILLELTGKSATRQLISDTGRLSVQRKSSDYQEKLGSQYFSAFPNYYKTAPANISGKQINRLSLAYPGNDSINNNWFEVQFVEEIYKALDRVKQQETGNLTGKINQTNTGILTLFQLGQLDLSVYGANSKDYSKILGELFAKYSIFMSYSGLLYRGILDLPSNICGPLANFEYKQIRLNVFDKIEAENQKFIIGNEIILATKGNVTDNGVTYTNLGNFGIKYIGFGEKTVDDAVNKLKPVLNELGKYSDTTYTETTYTGSVSKLQNVLSQNIKNKVIHDFITFKKSDNDINLFSVTSDKKVKSLTHYVDLTPNVTYFCDTSKELDGFSNNAKTINQDSSDTNIYQGLYVKMNENLKNITINTDFSRGSNYGADTNTPSLTFNSQSVDFADMGGLSGYKKVVSNSTQRYHQIFNI
jgi:hypothetical protein